MAKPSTAVRQERSCPLLLALVGALFACGCHRLPMGAVVVESLQISEGNLAGNPDLGISSDAARKALKTALEATGKFAVREQAAGPEGAGARVRLQIESARRLVPAHAQRGPLAAAELAEVAVLLELLLPAKGGDLDRLVAEGLSRKQSAGGPGASFDPEARAAAFEAALDGALGEAALSLVWQMQARRKSDEELLHDLEEREPRVRDYAIRVLADRRNPAAVPYLIQRLDDDSVLMVRRAMGALVAIGDRRAVRPLIELTRRRPPQFVAEVIYALASLGGAEVEAFLFTLESGSPDEEVRRAAAEAFTELHKKRDEAAAAVVPTPRPGGP